MHRSAWTYQESLNKSKMSQAPVLQGSSTLLSNLPQKDEWIEQGIVERRTVHANVIWRQRQMILTKDHIFFARIDSDLVVDKISVRDISSIGKVDNAIKGGGDEKHLNNKSTKSRKNSFLSNISRTDNFECFNDAHRETFAFEIKTYSSGIQRSFFVRVQTLQACESWISAVTSCWKSTLREFAERQSWIEKRQLDARWVQSTHSFRATSATAILLDFVSSIFRSEFLPQSGTQAALVFDAFDVILFTFFIMELSLNVFGNWRSVRGSPFVNRSSNWFQILTVLVQILGYIDQSLRSLKVIRIMRIFHVGAAFKGLASCQIVLKAIRRGACRECEEPCCSTSGSAHKSANIACRTARDELGRVVSASDTALPQRSCQSRRRSLS